MHDLFKYTHMGRAIAAAMSAVRKLLATAKHRLLLMMLLAL